MLVSQRGIRRSTVTDSSNVQMGTVALSTDAVLLGTHCSPQAKSENGTALFNNATSSSHGNNRRGGSGRPPIPSTIHINAAPSAQRNMAIQNGG